MTPALYLVAALAAADASPIEPGTVCTYAAPMPSETAPELVRVEVIVLAMTVTGEPGAWVEPIGDRWRRKAQWHLPVAKLLECTR